LTFVLSFVAIRYIGKIFELPINVWFWTLIALIVWSCVQYTGYIEDYLMLIFCTVLGISLRYLKMSRAAFIIGFVLSNRIESLFTQYQLLFNWYDVILRPISLTLVLITIVAIVYGIFFNNAKVNYT
jgi:TctA family transporter